MAEGGKNERLRAIDAIVSSLTLENEETGVLIDAMLSYRSIPDYERMVNFIKEMPSHIQQTVMVQEQLGFALNRLGKHDEALSVLQKVIEENGPSSETYGIMGRVYKDLFEKAKNDDNELLAESYLEKSLETYIEGFKADWRDAYPGVNAITLLDLIGDKERIKKLAPVVEYAVLRKLDNKKPEYWDYATLLELAVINNDESGAKESLKKAIACNIEGDWMFSTTIKNLSLLQSIRDKRKEENKLPEKMKELLEIQRNKFNTN
jgi:tetratricopeptide (TPR) repeat protein